VRKDTDTVIKSSYLYNEKRITQDVDIIVTKQKRSLKDINFISLLPYNRKSHDQRGDGRKESRKYQFHFPITTR